MKYSLRSLMLVGELSERDKGVGLLLIGLAIIGAGLFFILTPAKYILQSDWKTRSLYDRVLGSTGDEKKATAAAALFYRVFGGFFVIFGVVWLLVGLMALFSQGVP